MTLVERDSTCPREKSENENKDEILSLENSILDKSIVNIITDHFIDKNLTDQNNQKGEKDTRIENKNYAVETEGSKTIREKPNDNIVYPIDRSNKIKLSDQNHMGRSDIENDANKSFKSSNSM